MTNKPKWVEALESAERALNKAEDAATTDDMQSLNAVADTWIAVAREYRQQDSD